MRVLLGCFSVYRRLVITRLSRDASSLASPSPRLPTVTLPKPVVSEYRPAAPEAARGSGCERRASGGASPFLLTAPNRLKDKWATLASFTILVKVADEGLHLSFSG